MSALKPRPIPLADNRSPAAQFLEEHDILIQEVAVLKEQNVSLHTANASLLAEVGMLREELERTDRARIRLQGFAANLTARLAVINETISVAIKDAASHQVEPTLGKPEIIEAEAKVTRLTVGSGGAGALPKNEF